MKHLEITKVILVDSKDQEIGTMEKMEAHQKGLLHRAFSIFVFNSKKELLLQKRAIGKYHSEALWTNTCCSHPSPGETIVEAGQRRLMEEMGFSCELRNTFSFIYRVNLDHEMIEHELDHLIIGISGETPSLNPIEASDYLWMNLKDIQVEMSIHPEKYTSWFKIIIFEYFNQLTESLNTIINENLSKRNI